MTNEEIVRAKANLKALFEYAEQVFDELREVAEDYRQEIATTYDVDPEQVELWITHHETEIEAVIRPPKKKNHM